MEPTRLFLFEWPVDEAGYELTGTGKFVVGKGGVSRYYHPLVTDDGVHREFANLPETPEAVLRFASKYGDLWQEGRDSLDRWYQEIFMMRQLIELLDAKDKDKVFHAYFNRPHTAPPARFCIVYDDKRRPVIQAVPQNLIAAMQLMVANEFVRTIEYKPCEQCPKWIPVGPGTGRKGKGKTRFCSTTCRVAWHRQHKALQESEQ
jgi:hypothetical protein